MTVIRSYNTFLCYPFDNSGSHRFGLQTYKPPKCLLTISESLNELNQVTFDIPDMNLFKNEIFLVCIAIMIFVLGIWFIKRDNNNQSTQVASIELKQVQPLSTIATVPCHPDYITLFPEKHFIKLQE